MTIILVKYNNLSVKEPNTRAEKKAGMCLEAAI